ncbi:hypothetical protein FPCIR_13926 [Fusarium pseudocircinatum]|uniref:Uncharacterized protein n=1 Tax=Fusarium pseudocircinatum TaxID=56676 RepID=A0A8H5KG18_9HYPO|nr:hypothetical protein FPCIR_13926 [Fusarium pseudocircinatum]
MAVYYETSWSILSTIGLVNFFFAWIVIGITRLSWLSAIPAIVSAAGAVANGLCYYAWYMNSGKPKTATAYAVADILWMIQEAGLSFYSYIILKQVLQNKVRRIFLILFWFFMLCICMTRILLLIYRIKSIFTGEEAFTDVVNGAHVGYFFSLASVECLSAFFLLQVFIKAKKTSEQLSMRSDFSRYLIRSTELRLACLALIGISRAITFLFHPPISGAASISSQIDVFLYTLECLFPVVLFIDLLASKLTFTHGSQNESYHLTQRRTVGRERLPSIDNTSFPRVVDLEHQNNAQSKETTRFTTRNWTSSSSRESRLINTDNGSNTSQVGIVKTITTTVITSA